MRIADELKNWSEDIAKYELHPILKTLNANFGETISNFKEEIEKTSNFLHCKQSDLIKTQSPLKTIGLNFKQIEKLLNNQVDKVAFNMSQKLVESCIETLNSIEQKFLPVLDKISLAKILSPFYSELETKIELLENGLKKVLKQNFEDLVEKEILDLLTEHRNNMESLDSSYKDLISDPPESKEDILHSLKEILTNLEKIYLELESSMFTDATTEVKVLAKAVKSKLQKVKTRVQRLFSQTKATVIGDLTEDEKKVRSNSFMTMWKNKMQSWGTMTLNWDYLVSILSKIQVRFLIN